MKHLDSVFKREKKPSYQEMLSLTNELERKAKITGYFAGTEKRGLGSRPVHDG